MPPSRGWAGTPPRAGLGGAAHRRRVPRPGDRLGRGRRPPGRSPEPVRRRLRDLSDRFYGAQAIHMRERPIPWAYRVFFRQIGLDPDRTRTPIEQLAFERIHDGAFKSQGLPADALTVATVETGVALRAFDADRLSGSLCIRDSAPGEALPGQPRRAGAGDADDRRRAAARSACCSGPPARATGSSPRAAGWRSSRSRSRACRRSPSTRRSGWRRRRSRRPGP